MTSGIGNNLPIQGPGDQGGAQNIGDTKGKLESFPDTLNQVEQDQASDKEYGLPQGTTGLNRDIAKYSTIGKSSESKGISGVSASLSKGVSSVGTGILSFGKLSVKAVGGLIVGVLGGVAGGFAGGFAGELLGGLSARKDISNAKGTTAKSLAYGAAPFKIIGSLIKGVCLGAFFGAKVALIEASLLKGESAKELGDFVKSFGVK